MPGQPHGWWSRCLNEQLSRSKQASAYQISVRSAALPPIKLNRCLFFHYSPFSLFANPFHFHAFNLACRSCSIPRRERTVRM